MSHIVFEKVVLDEIFVLSKKLPNLVNYIKKEINGVDLVCNYKSLEVLQEEARTNPLIEYFLDRINSIKLVADLRSIIKDKTIYEYVGESSIFLIDIIDKEIEGIKKEKPYLFYNISLLKELEEYIVLYQQNSTLKVTGDNLLSQDVKFSKWSDLDRYFKNVESVIIFDKYLLKETSQSNFNNNIFSIIDCLERSSFYPINLTIISEFDNDSELDTTYNKLMDYVRLKKYNLKLNLISHVKHIYPRNFEGFHSRFILTNYFYFISTDSFNYFKPNGRVKNSCEIIISCNIFKNNRSLYLKEIRTLKEYIALVKNDPSNPSVLLRKMFSPHKSNPLI